MNRPKTLAPRGPRQYQRSFWRNTSGAAAVEFVLWTGIMVIPILSAVDIAYYAYQRMQVEVAAQAAVQAAFHSCDPMTQLPAASKCAGVLANMTAAAQSTTLGTAVTFATAPVEGYYCVDNAYQMVLMGTSEPILAAGGTAPTVPNPFSCASVVPGSNSQPGDYVSVTVTHSFTPIFSGISVAQLLSTEIHRTAWMRLS